MPSRKVLFVGAMFIAFLMKAWWLFLPMLGFCLGYIARAEKDRKKKA